VTRQCQRLTPESFRTTSFFSGERPIFVASRVIGYSRLPPAPLHFSVPYVAAIESCGHVRRQDVENVD
jgi:hypothetical protein